MSGWASGGASSGCIRTEGPRRGPSLSGQALRARMHARACGCWGQQPGVGAAAGDASHGARPGMAASARVPIEQGGCFDQQRPAAAVAVAAAAAFPDFLSTS